MPKNYKNQPSINRFNFIRWYQDINLIANGEFAVGSGNNFTNWTKTIPTHQNLAAFNSEYDNAYWTKIGAGIVPNAISGPFGTNLADKFYPTSTGTGKRIFRNITGLSNGSYYVSSIYAKKGEKNYIGLYGVNIIKSAVFNLDTGVIAYQDAGLIAGVESLDNGWFRCWVAEQVSGTSGYFYAIALDNTASVTSASGTDGIYIDGAQFEPGTSPTKLIYTNTTSITEDDGQIVEAVRKNYLLRNSEYNSSFWVKTRTSVDPNVLSAPPFDTQTADKIIEGTDSSTTFFINSQNVTVTNEIHTISFYIKAGGRNRVQCELSGGISYGAGFNLSNGTIFTTNLSGVVQSTTTTIEHIKNGWYRCSFTQKFSVGTTLKLYIYLDNGSGTVYTGDGVSGIYLGESQLEPGTIATASIPTLSSVVTVNDGISESRAIRLDSGITTGMAINQASVLGAAGKYKVSFWAKKASSVNPTLTLKSDTSTFNSIVLNSIEYQKFNVELNAVLADNQIRFFNDTANSSIVIDNIRIEQITETSAQGPSIGYTKFGNHNSMPILAPTDTFRFYLNADTPISGLTKTDLILALYNEFGVRVYSWSTSVLNEITVGAGKHYYSTDIDLSVLSGLSSGVHYLAIYNTATGNILYTSNYVWLLQNEYLDISSKIEFRHYKNIFKIQYEHNDLAAFTQKMRIMLLENEIDYGGEMNQYKEITTGKVRMNSKYDERVIKVETYYFDRDMHEAMDVLSKHETLSINGKSYIAKANYTPNINPLEYVSKGELELIDQEYSQLNK